MRPGQSQAEHRAIGKGRRACRRHTGLGLDCWWAGEVVKSRAIFSAGAGSREQGEGGSTAQFRTRDSSRARCSRGGGAATPPEGGRPVQPRSGQGSRRPPARCSCHLVASLRLPLWATRGPPGLCPFPREVLLSTRLLFPFSNTCHTCIFPSTLRTHQGPCLSSSNFVHSPPSTSCSPCRPACHRLR